MAAFDLIEEQILGSNATSVEFSSIPDDYAHLKLEITCEANSSDEPIYIRFNGDTGSTNYQWYSFYAYNGTSSYGGQFDYQDAQIKLGEALSTSYVGCCEVWIPNYTNTSIWQSTLTRFMNRRWWSQSVGGWRSTSTPATILLWTPVNNNFQSGGQFKLWGYKDE